MPSIAIGCASAGKVYGDLVLEQFGRHRGVVFLLGGFRGGHFRPRRLEPGTKAAQIAVDRLAVVADRGFELLDRERQFAAAGDGAEHHRVDDRAALLRELVHVDEQSCRARCRRSTLISRSSSKRPSPMAIFSSMA